MINPRILRRGRRRRTRTGIWSSAPATVYGRMSGDNAERIALAGKIVVHVADRNGTVLAAVARDGVYEISDSGERRIWEGDARAAAIGPDGRFYVGTEPAMVFRSDDGGRTWRRSDKIDELPTREKWYFPGPPHQPHVRSIDFLPDAEASVLVGVEVGGVVHSADYGDSWSELNNGLHVDVHTVRPDPSEPGRLIAATGKGLYLSENNGDSWQQITEGIGQGYTVGLHVNPERVGEVLIATGQRPPGISARVYTLSTADAAGIRWSTLSCPNSMRGSRSSYSLMGTRGLLRMRDRSSVRRQLRQTASPIVVRVSEAGRWSRTCRLPSRPHRRARAQARFPPDSRTGFDEPTFHRRERLTWTSSSRWTSSRTTVSTDCSKRSACGPLSGRGYSGIEALTYSCRPMAPRAASIWSQPRAVLDIQYSIDLGQMPPEAPSQFGFADALVHHALVQHHFHGREGRQNSVVCTLRRGRNHLAVMDAGRNRLFQRVDGSRDSLVPIVPVGGQLREVRGRCQHSAVIVFES